jgi:hypothetical protein
VAIKQKEEEIEIKLYIFIAKKKNADISIFSLLDFYCVYYSKKKLLLIN